MEKDKDFILKNVLIDLNFDDTERENSLEFQKLTKKYEIKIMKIIKEKGFFKFHFTLIELVFLRVSLESFLRFPNLERDSKFSYDSGKRIIEYIDMILRENNFSHQEIANIEKPNSIEELKNPISKALNLPEKNFDLILNPLEYGIFQGTLILNLREGMRSFENWRTFGILIPILSQALIQCNENLRKLGFEEREIFILNNQLMDLPEKDNEIDENED